MLSFSTLTVLAIAAQSLFAGVDAAVLPKRQTEVPSQGSVNPFDGIIQAFIASLNGSSSFPLNLNSINFNATYGPDNEGSNPFGAFFPDFISAAIKGFAGPGNNVSVISVPGQFPSYVGLGISSANGTSPSGVDSIIPDILGPFSYLLSYFASGDFTAFSVSPPGGGSPFSGQNATFPSLNGTTLPSSPSLNGTTPPSFPSFNGTTPPSSPSFNGTTPPSFSGFNGTTLPYQGFNGTTPPFQGSNDTTPFPPGASNITLPSEAIPPVTFTPSPTFSLPTQSLPTQIPTETDIPTDSLPAEGPTETIPTSVSTSESAIPTEAV